jgi:hypothetical protein
VYGGIILYGLASDPNPGDSTRTNYSPYFEIKYLGTLNDYSYEVFTGFTPSESTLYQTTGFAFTNIGLSAKRTIPVTDNFALPLKLTLATNPVIKKIYLALLVSL